MARVSALLQVAGLAAVALGVAAFNVPAGVVVCGLGLFAIGVVIALPPRRSR